MSKAPDRPHPGTRVILKMLPPRFLDSLPRYDKNAIKAVVGKPVLLVQYDDDDGRMELEFRDKNGAHHMIWVSPECVGPAE